jgi:prevent-host-death family protein
MSTYSVAEAKAKLSALIDEAIGGEPVTITRHGHPVVEVRAAARKQSTAKSRPASKVQADIDWLVKHRVGRKPAKESAAALISRMRDEDWK